jgi:hypothetical protein
VAAARAGQKVEGVERRLPARLAHGVERRADEQVVLHTRHVGRRLEGQEQAGARALLGAAPAGPGRQNAPAADNAVARVAGQRQAQRALAAAVGAHQHQQRAGGHVERDRLQHVRSPTSTRRSRTCSRGSWVMVRMPGVDGVGAQPTAPSSDTASKALASSANSIGSLEHGLAEAADDQRRGLLRVDAALLAVEQALLGDARGGGLVFDHGVAARHVDVGEGVGAAVGADQQRVALRVVARAGAGAPCAPGRGSCCARGRR